MFIGENFIFLHIPKTAGTSIAHALRDHMEMKWTRHSIFNSGNIDRAKEKTVFAVVRNPWARYVSLWRWWDEKEWFENNKTPPFKEFVRNLDRYRLASPVTRWTHYEERQVVDCILLFESLGERFPALMKELGLDVQLPEIKHHQNGQYDYRNFYDEELIEDIAAREHWVIGEFGYKFGDPS